MENIINDLNQIENAIKTLESKRDELKTKLIDELKNTESKNYRTDKALYSLKTISNDEFNESKFKEEHEDVYNNYLKTKVSFDITTFKKKEKKLLKQYTEKGETTYSLMIKENKIEQTTEEKTPVEELSL
ncbi:MAG: hypothetical protein SPJ27_09130 [Candidatus Onthovivens sp.]|nr:hypothetical protein [Candidatus Onthovivens sp.]